MREMTDEQLTEIAARANAATPAPWSNGRLYSLLKYASKNERSQARRRSPTP
jgi:hypothetical protein